MPIPQALEIDSTGVVRIVQVDDDEVAKPMRVLYAGTHNVAEGAAALAALLQELWDDGALSC
jgi:threonine dehydratase